MHRTEPDAARDNHVQRPWYAGPLAFLGALLTGVGCVPALLGAVMSALALIAVVQAFGYTGTSPDASGAVILTAPIFIAGCVAITTVSASIVAIGLLLIVISVVRSSSRRPVRWALVGPVAAGFILGVAAVIVAIMLPSSNGMHWLEALLRIGMSIASGS